MLGSNFGVLRYLPWRFTAKVTEVTWYLNNRMHNCKKMLVWKLINIVDPPNPVVNHHVSRIFRVLPGWNTRALRHLQQLASHGPRLRLWEVEQGPVGQCGPPVYDSVQLLNITPMKHYGLWYLENELVFMGVINQHSHHWGGPSPM